MDMSKLLEKDDPKLSVLKKPGFGNPAMGGVFKSVYL